MHNVYFFIMIKRTKLPKRELSENDNNHEFETNQ